MKIPTLERPHPTMGGVQRLYRFSNNRGASVIQSRYSYGSQEGKWELAVLTFTGEDVTNFFIDYTTPLTDDVLGYLSEEEVDDLLGQVEALPPFKGERE